MHSVRKFDWPARPESVVAQWLAHLPLVLEVPGSIPARGEENFGVRTRSVHRPSDLDVNWMSPVQGKSPLMRTLRSFRYDYL